MPDTKPHVICSECLAVWPNDDYMELSEFDELAGYYRSDDFRIVLCTSDEYILLTQTEGN